MAVDVDRMAIDGAHLTTKQIVGHAFCGAATGAALGAAGGAIGAKFNAIGSSTNANKIAFTIIGRRLGKKAIQSITTRVVEGAIGDTSNAFSTIMEERLDDEAENGSLIEHGKNFGVGLVSGIVKNVAVGARAELKRSGEQTPSEEHPSRKKIEVGDHHKMKFSALKPNANRVNVVDNVDDDDSDGE